MSKSKKITMKNNPFIRIFSGIVGFVILIFLFVYSFRWESIGIEFSAFGYDISNYAWATLLILSGILASTLFKSALIGKWRVDI